MVFDLSVSISQLFISYSSKTLSPLCFLNSTHSWLYPKFTGQISVSFSLSSSSFLSLIIGRPQVSLLRLFLLYYTHFRCNLILYHGFQFPFCADDLYLQYRPRPLNSWLHPAAYSTVILNRNSKLNMSMWSCLPKTCFTHLSIKAHSKSILPFGQVNNLGVIPDSFIKYPKCCEIMLALPLKYIQHLTHSPATQWPLHPYSCPPSSQSILETTARMSHSFAQRLKAHQWLPNSLQVKAKC